jgi:hypothetical protein
MQTIRIAIASVIIGLAFLLPTPVLAKEINFEASVDRNKVSLGEALQLSLTFDGTQNIAALDLPVIEGFQSRYLGPSTRMSIINGQASSSVTHVYTLLPTKLGVFKIGPFKFEHNGDKYNSNAISVEVVKEAASSAENQVPAGGQTEIKDLNERIFLTLKVQKNSSYLNEIIPLTVKLYVNRLGVRDIQFPQFSHDGLSVGGFEQPKQYQENLSGINYDVIEFNTTIFGLRPGEFRLGPASLACNLIVKKQSKVRGDQPFNDFFNADVLDDLFARYETYPLNLKSTDIPITVLPLPEENKPEGFSGALGEFNFEVSVAPGEAKVGDPLTLKATFSGQGNFNTVSLPKINFGNDFKTYEPQIKQEKETKTFEQVLIPLNADIKEIQAINFSFFNSSTARYETITRGPLPLKIVKPEKEEEFKIIESKQPAVNLAGEEKLGRDIIYLKDNLGKLKKKGEYLYKNKIFLGLQIIPLLCYLLTVMVYAKNRKLKTDLKYARQLFAPRKAKAGIRQAKNYLDKGSILEFYDILFATLQGYLGDKFHFPSKSITVSIIDDYLKNMSVAEETLEKLRDIFKECDMVRYAASQLTKDNMQDSLRKLEEVIDYFQRKKV